MALPTRYDPLPIVLVVLTITTGLVDAVSVLGLGRVFTANMTGNIVFLGFALAVLIGAILGGRLGVAMAGGSRRRWLLTVAVVESGLLFAAAWIAIGYDIDTATPVTGLYAMIVLTAVAMGLRNATVRRLAVPDLTTTVLTLTLTGIAADSALAGGRNLRWGYRLAAVVSIFAGAAIGAVLVSEGGLPWPLVVTGACILLATVVYAVHPASRLSAHDARSGGPS
jgi:uncharacterized membrane protein YoaK (UPF0700 family)